jgi:putative transposase
VGPFDALPVPGNHSIAALFVHLVWATQHRAPKLEPSVDAGLAALLERKARRLDARILAAGNAADHVHVLLRYPPRVPVAQIAHLLKGASSRALNRLAPNPSPAFWQVGYWAESVGPSDLDPLVGYIRQQRAHHRAHAILEPWEMAPR